MSLISFALLLALGWPLCVALLGVRERFTTPLGERDHLGWLWVSAAWPAVLLATLGEHQWLISGLLLGADWELSPLSRGWLMFTALLWSLAALHARGYFALEQQQAREGDEKASRRLTRLAVFWPLTLLGNLLLIVAQDIPSFYLGFALMTFAAYALVVHNGSEAAQLGGRAYLVLAILGEILILAGWLWAAGEGNILTFEELREGIAQLDNGVWMALLLWLGFGVKAGVIGLHIWLPLAHPVAPAPASAVLSGAMIKAGLLGWINVLPLGNEMLSAAWSILGQVILVAGLAAALGAAGYGVWQRQPKAVLAYSSISQMGMLTALVAMGLVAPDIWPLLWPAVLLFAAHHALAKGALFMGTAISEHPPAWPRGLLFVLLALPGISLAGSLAAGMATKWSMKSVLYTQDHTTLVLWLTIAAIGTSALVSVTLWRQWQQQGEPGSNACQLTAWLMALVIALSTPFWLPLPQGAAVSPPLAEWWGLIWPYPSGVLLVIAVIWSVRRMRWPVYPMPAGDAWWWYTRWAKAGITSFTRLAERLLTYKKHVTALAVQTEKQAMQQITHFMLMERWMRRHTAGLMMALAILLALLTLII